MVQMINIGYGAYRKCAQVGVRTVMQPIIARRRVIETIAALGILTTVMPVLALAGTKGMCLRQSEVERLIYFLRNRKGAQAIGRIYLQSFPQEADVQYLLHAILSRNESIRRVTAYGRKGDVLASLRELIGNDFAEGRTVCVDGWILSQTEARLCSLTCFVSY